MVKTLKNVEIETRDRDHVENGDFRVFETVERILKNKT
jgi:hypothetical protein